MGKKLTIGIIGTIALLGLIFSTPVMAEGDAELDVYVEADGNVNASFDATAGGDVNYWIDGIEVKGEFISIWEAMGEFDTVWDFINHLNEQLGQTDAKADEAYELADNAFGYAASAYSYAQNNDQRIKENATILTVLFNEVVLFEEDYSDFKNETHLNFTSVKDTLDDHEVRISNLESKVGTLEGQVVVLEGSIDELKATLGNLGKIGIVGLIAGGLFLTNRRYPFKDVVKNGKGIFGRHGTGSSAQKVKSKANMKSARKASKLKVNHKRSPMKLFMKSIKL